MNTTFDTGSIYGNDYVAVHQTIESYNINHQFKNDGHAKYLDKIIDELYQKVYQLTCDKISLQTENDLLKTKLDELYYRKGVSY